VITCASQAQQDTRFLVVIFGYYNGTVLYTKSEIKGSSPTRLQNDFVTRTYSL
jgi:hypothetical protein